MRESINKANVGKIAERIVANELEFRGFRVSDLNKDGTSTNADLLAARDGKTWQIQVKGSTNEDGATSWWVQYGYCTDKMITDRSERMFNRHSSFYQADIVVLAAVRSPKEYCCVVLPAEVAEKLAQTNLDRYYRTPKRDGTSKTGHKVWVQLEASAKERDATTKAFAGERALLNRYKDEWEQAFSNCAATSSARAPSCGIREE